MDIKEPPKTRKEKKGDKQKRKKELFGKYNSKHIRQVQPASSVKPRKTEWPS
jgi:hypothetical protein